MQSGSLSEKQILSYLQLYLTGYQEMQDGIFCGSDEALIIFSLFPVPCNYIIGGDDIVWSKSFARIVLKGNQKRMREDV